jgi:hypothetical protein
MWVVVFIFVAWTIANLAIPTGLGIWNWVLIGVAFIFLGWAFTKQDVRGTYRYWNRPPASKRSIILYGIVVVGFLLYVLLLH